MADPSQPKPKRRGRTVAIVIGSILAMGIVNSALIGDRADEVTPTFKMAEETTEAPVTTEAPARTEAPVTTEAPATTEAPVTTEAPAAPTTQAPESQLSVSEQNAIRAAESYLDYTAFSRTGLIGKLEYEGYTTEEATLAVDSITVDWNEQAAKKAASYLEYSAFSRSGLIDQLVYEGYTIEQATYGVDQVGL